MTELGKKMVERSDADGLAPDHALRTTAKAFDDAAAGFYAEPQTVKAPQFLGAWARARRAWSEYSGERLI